MMGGKDGGTGLRLKMGITDSRVGYRMILESYCGK